MSRSCYLFSALLLILAAVSFAASQPTIVKKEMEPTKAWAGDQMFHSYCASCHGEAGKGDGPAAPAMKNAVPDLTTLAKRNGGKFPDRQLMNVIKGDQNRIAHGSEGMPVWGPLLRANATSHGEEDLRVHNLVRYIEKLQAK